jgi:hypothetical protein
MHQNGCWVSCLIHEIKLPCQDASPSNQGVVLFWALYFPCLWPVCCQLCLAPWGLWSRQRRHSKVCSWSLTGHALCLCWTKVWQEGTLGLTVILFWHWGIRAVLRTWRGCVLVFLELLLDVPWHRYVKCMLFAILFEAYATIQVASSVWGKLYLLFTHLMKWLTSSCLSYFTPKPWTTNH